MMKKINLEAVFLLIVFFTMLWSGCAVLFDYKTSHDFPFAYLASDTFQHQVRAESIKEMGNYQYEAPYIVAGYNDNPGFYPPLVYHAGILFSYASGLETYDSTYLLVFILACFAALIMYLIIKQLNKSMAILSLPLSFLIFSNAPYIGFTWGHWPAVTAQFFLIAFFWLLSNIDLKKSFILFAIFLSGIIMTHTSEAIFAAIFLAIFFIYRFIRKDYSVLLKQSVIGAVISFIVCFYYLIIFKFTWAKMQAYSFYVEPAWESPMFGLFSFKLLLIFILIGIIFSIFYFKKTTSAAFFVGFIMVVIGYGNYFGFGPRAFQARFFWPIYLSIFFGAGLYFVLNMITKQKAVIFGISILLVILLNLSFFSAVSPVTSRFTSSGIMDPQHWEMYKWFQENVETNSAKVLFFYGDSFGQNAILRNTHQPPYKVTVGFLTESIENKTIPRYYLASLLGDHHGVYYAYRKSFFDYGYHAEEEEAKDPTFYYRKMRDVCEFDYLVFDKLSQQPVFAQFNMLIANELAQKDWIRPAFENDYVAVLKNNKPGEGCIDERKFE